MPETLMYRTIRVALIQMAVSCEIRPYDISETIMPRPRNWMISSDTIAKTATTETSTPMARLSYFDAK